MTHFNGNYGIALSMTKNVFTEPLKRSIPLPHMMLFSAEFSNLPHAVAKQTLLKVRQIIIHHMPNIELSEQPVFENEQWIWEASPCQALHEAHEGALTLCQYAVTEPLSPDHRIVLKEKASLKQRIYLNLHFCPDFVQIHDKNTVEMITL